MAVSNTIKVTFTGNASALQKAAKEASSSIEGVGAKTSTVGGKIGSAFSVAGKAIAVAAAAASAAIIGVTKKAVEAYAEYEQLTGGIEAMFKSAANGAELISKVTDTASNAWKDLTLSMNDYYTTFNSTYPLVKASIKDQNEAIDQTNKLMTLESDLANTFGYSIENAATAINWALKGSFNYIDNLNLGIKGTEQGVTEAARSFGYMVDSAKELTSAQLIDVLTKQAELFGVNGRTALEAAETIQGSTKMIKAAWENLLVGMADDSVDFDALIDNFVEAAGNFGKNVLPRIEKVLKGVASLIEKLGPIIVKALPDLVRQVLPGLLNAALMIVVEITKILPDLIKTLIQVICDTLPMLLTDVIPVILSLIPQIAQDLIVAVTDALPQIINAVVLMLASPKFWNALFNAVMGLASVVLEVPSKIGGSLITVIGQTLGTIWNNIKNKIGEFASKIATGISGGFEGAFKKAVNGVFGWFEKTVNNMIGKINGFIDVINKALGWAGVNVGKIATISLPRMANGGIIQGNSYTGDNQLARVNAGEMVINRSQQASLWRFIENGSLGGGNSDVNIERGAVVVNVTNSNAKPEDIGDAVAISMAKAIQRAFKSQGVEPQLNNARILR